MKNGRQVPFFKETWRPLPAPTSPSPALPTDHLPDFLTQAKVILYKFCGELSQLVQYTKDTFWANIELPLQKIDNSRIKTILLCYYYNIIFAFF